MGRCTFRCDSCLWLSALFEYAADSGLGVVFHIYGLWKKIREEVIAEYVAGGESHCAAGSPVAALRGGTTIWRLFMVRCIFRCDFRFGFLALFQ